MIKHLLLLSLLVSICLCSESLAVKDSGKQYKWLLDMIVIIFDSQIIFLLTPIWWFASFFANCQTCYQTMVDKVLKKIPLSYDYV
jgi:hypothetical protein